MIRVTNGFGNLSFANFSKILASIIQNMLNNPYFANLQTQVAALSAAADNYYVLDAKAEKRDKDVLLARNTARIEITNLLHQIGFSVSSLANGSKEILSSSGFPFTQPPQKSMPMQKPPPPTVFSGINNGDIGCKTISQKGMKSLKYYITSDATALTAGGEANWDVISWNSTKYTFSNLTPGQRYYIKVGMVGVRGQEVVSEPVSYIPQ